MHATNQAPIRVLLAETLLRAVAALETPADLSEEEKLHVINDARAALDRHEVETHAEPEAVAALLSLHSAAEPVYRKAGFVFLPMDRALNSAGQVLRRLVPGFGTSEASAPESVPG